MKRLTKTSMLPVVAGFALSACQGQKQADAEYPNVIIIMADDIGYGDLSWMGATTISTPNVDRLVARGVRFSNSYSTSATSTPSRFGMLTGMYPWRKEGTGIAAGDAAMIIDSAQYSMADMFKSVGYNTAAIGKWHLGIGGERGKQNWNGLITPNLSDIGFDYSFIMAATGDRVPCVYIENGRVANLDPNDPISVSYSEPLPGAPTPYTHPELLRLHPSQGHDNAIVNGISRIGYMTGGKAALWNDEDIADVITNKAVDFIIENQNRAFFMYFGTHDIHVPRIPHERFKGKSGMGDRGDAILSFDYSIGRLLDVLDSLNIGNNTLIVLTSDNGPVLDDGYHDRAVELLGNHKPAANLRAGKYSIYEAGTRVPCIISWPAKQKNLASVNKALVSQIDFMASFAAIVGAQMPANAAMDSRNLKNTLLNKSQKGAPYIIQQNLNNTLSIVSQHWKLIETSNDDPIEFWTKTELGNSKALQLYNLNNDPSESTNLANEKTKKAKELLEILSNEKAKKPL